MKSAFVVVAALMVPAGTALAQRPHREPHPAGHEYPHTCARPHPVPHASHRLGNYDLQLEMHGQQTSALLKISCAKDGKLLGTLEVHGDAIELEVVRVEGQVVTLAAGSELSLTLTFKNENELTGQWVRGDESGGIAGTRQKS